MNATLLLLALFAGEHIKSAKQAFESGTRAMAGGNWAVAEKAFLKAIDIEPTYIHAYRSLVDVYAWTNRQTEAGAMLTRLLQIEPNSVEDRIRLGRLLIEGQEWSRALAQFSIARKLAPWNADALYGFALAASKSGMIAAAVDVLREGSSRFREDKRFSLLLEKLKSGEVTDYTK